MMRLIFPVLGSFLVAFPASATSGDSLNNILAQMDKTAGAFQSMSANMTQLTHTEVINENETQNAQVKMKKTKAGIIGKVEFSGANRMTVGIRERQVEKYHPQSNIVELYDVGKYGDQLDQFLLLGFSTSGKELQRNYKIRLIGQEDVGGRSTNHLELIPKSKQAQDIFKRADIWLAQDANHPIQEKIYKNDQDYILLNYSDVKVNPPMNDKELELNLPANVKKITPQK